jgi:hypothetical protein
MINEKIKPNPLVLIVRSSSMLELDVTQSFSATDTAAGTPRLESAQCGGVNEYVYLFSANRDT